MNSILKIQKVFKNYKVKPYDVLVLKDINLEVQKGDFVMIFGPSGSGKSTLLNLILGLEKPTSGRIEFDGVDIANSSEEQLAMFRKNKVGIIYQQPYWIKSLNVVENVAFPLVLRGISKAEADLKALEILNTLNIADRASFHPNELSSGQQQKVSLARALVSDPEIIIADEPTGNLDYKSGQELTQSLAKLSAEGRTIIMVTHNIDNLDDAKRFIYIFDGHIVEDQPVNSQSINKLKAILVSGEQEANKLKATNEKPENFRPPLILAENTRTNIFKSLASNFYIILISVFLIFLTIFYNIAIFLFRARAFRINLAKGYENILNNIGDTKDRSISYGNIFYLSLKNLFTKRIRALITVGGVALGIGFTVFLISIGYGLENLVIVQVASLNQLKEIDVSPSIGETVKVNDESLETLRKVNNVVQVLPVVGLAGNINYEGSNTDVVVYAVQYDYLKNSDIKVIKGDFFKDNSVEALKNTTATRDIFVNIPFLTLIGLNQNNAIGKELSLTYTLVNNTNLDSAKKFSPFNYKIIGITSTGDSPFVYVPFSDAKTLGIKDYTAARIITNTKESVPEVRQILNVMGLRTSSILDTISQIEGFFANVRLIFALVGSVALSVASLGMFNTLTVSLLERTREVGLMKAIGMKSEEVKKLFLAESITMGLFGGLLGIIIGVIGGYAISLIISIISISRGYSYLNIVYLPFTTVLLVLFIAGVTGIVTGFYPARRATKISALDALRYE